MGGSDDRNAAMLAIHTVRRKWHFSVLFIDMID
jgi:hypothetical protein